MPFLAQRPAASYRYNDTNDAGVDCGDVLFLDAVWMLELNFERQERARAGGSRLFFLPGLVWTWRNVAVKPGIQIPVWSDLNGSQQGPDYRGLIEVEVHL